MSPGPSPGPVESRLHDDVPIVDAESAAAAIDPGATVLTSGFGSVGYPKAIPLALASSPRDLSLTLVASGKVGDKIDVELVGSGQVERRFSYQSSRVAREKTDTREIAFSDRNASSIGDEVQYGGLVDPDVAVVEAVAVGEDWFIPSTSLGQVPAFVEAADTLFVELNRHQPLELQTMRPRTAGRSRCRTPASASAPARRVRLREARGRRRDGSRRFDVHVPRPDRRRPRHRRQPRVVPPPRDGPIPGVRRRDPPPVRRRIAR